ncbi:hypothetical protein [Streptomyces sp. MAI_2237]
MSTQRLTELPNAVLRLIEKASGSPVVDIAMIRAGLNSAIAARVTTASRTMFVKGPPRACCGIARPTAGAYWPSNTSKDTTPTTLPPPPTCPPSWPA